MSGIDLERIEALLDEDWSAAVAGEREAALREVVPELRRLESGAAAAFAAIELLTQAAGTLKADNARLRALVKESEWHAGDREGWCQFCGSLPDGADGMASDDRHSPDCRAFTPGGVVK